jgi:hypothetical protein
MRQYGCLSCCLALLGAASLPESAGAQSGDIAASDYSDYFGDGQREQPEGPHSLSEARATGKAYRLGQSGSVYRRPVHDAHTVQEGDTLWDISERYFGDPWHWPELWSYNPEVTNPHWIYPLDQVRLSAEALDRAQHSPSAPAAGKKVVAAEFKEPAQGLATDLAPRVTIPKHLFSKDSVFLRDQGYLDDEELGASGRIVAGGEEQMLLANSDLIYIKFNKGQDVREGQQYTVYRPVYKREREKGEKGKLVRIQGTALIRSYDSAKGMARALITETLDPIERGMPVTMMQRRFDLVPPKPNAKDVVAHIIGSVQPRRLLAYSNVVFLDVGQGHGIVPGNRFFVVRRGDNWQDVLSRPSDQMGNIMPIPEYNKADLPKEVVAEMRVVKVRKKVTIAVITRSDTDVFQGDTVEMRVGY